jgi:hypothetical protein
VCPQRFNHRGHGGAQREREILSLVLIHSCKWGCFDRAVRVAALSSPLRPACRPDSGGDECVRRYGCQCSASNRSTFMRCKIFGEPRRRSLRVYSREATGMSGEDSFRGRSWCAAGAGSFDCGFASRSRSKILAQDDRSGVAAQGGGS